MNLPVAFLTLKQELVAATHWKPNGVSPAEQLYMGFIFLLWSMYIRQSPVKTYQRRSIYSNGITCIIVV